jgi:TPP-dependent pyruvate/acetoin dehydrogenase alpha subunit
VYESLNLAGLWKLPILYVLEDNRIAQTTPVKLSLAGDMAGRFSAFSLPVWELDTYDPLEIREIAIEMLSSMRKTNQPAVMILHTHRFSAHSKGDDTRSPTELASIRKFDPLTLLSARLGQDDCLKADLEVSQVIADAFLRADSDPYPLPAVNT